MRNNIKTARGAVIDMAALAAKNETTRAVGNVPMNATLVYLAIHSYFTLVQQFLVMPLQKPFVLEKK